jgi:TolB-like protein/Tfp pilus assembly protein PilF
MFTDVVGYTALMGEDEEKAFNILKKNRDLQRPIIEKHGGRWIKEIGDGVLSTFSSVTDSVLAAADIQSACKAEASYSLRIGLHLSEVIFEDDDVFGDGVNIAARIQSIASSGSILISEPVQRNLANKRGIEIRFSGQEFLKNIKEPISLYEVIINEEYVGLHTQKLTRQSPRKNQEKSLAVLPFRNISKDIEQEYFGDGIAEEIIVTLSNIDNLKVVGRSSSFQFKESSLTINEIGNMLSVSTILEGSVRRVRNNVRIYAELINIEDGVQMWAERYDREFTDIFDIQDDIASNIAKKLMLRFFGEGARSIPINMEAYEFLLKGRFYLDKYIEGFHKALACFTRAIEIDPRYGEAYCELAKVYFLLTMNLFFTPKEGFERAKFYAEKGLSLNNQLAAGHYVLGQIYFWYNWNFGRAKQEYELAETSTEVFYFTGVVIDPWYKAFAHGDYAGAIASVQKILESDPLSLYAQFQLAFFYCLSRQQEAAREILYKILYIVPEFSEAERILGYTYLLENDTENALVHARKAAQMAGGLGWSQNFYIIALAKNGDHEVARKELEQWKAQNGPLNISPLGLGLIHSHLGEIDKAFEYFNYSLEYHDIWAASFKYNPEFDHLRDDPRFQALIDKIGYPA